jgi:transcription elongation factor Elf1
MTYSEKLKSPKWQKKRLEILQRDNFNCRNCGDTESSLHVHHIKYIANTDPWDYDEKYLLTLCESCHSESTWQKNDIKKIIDEEFVFVEYISELRLLLLKVQHMNPYQIDQLTKSIDYE